MLGEVKQAANVVPDDKDPAYNAYLKKIRDDEASVPRLYVSTCIFPPLKHCLLEDSADFGESCLQDNDGAEGEGNFDSGTNRHCCHTRCPNIQ
jgi:hypothetical protein